MEVIDKRIAHALIKVQKIYRNVIVFQLKDNNKLNERPVCLLSFYFLNLQIA
jgi:hypothetical protein